MKVLVVDDSKLARMAMAKVLASLRSGWTRVEAANADEAIAKVKDERPDIAVFDFNMPGRDGLTLAADFRALRPTMPVAVITANLQHEVVAKANAAGASFLPKPLTQEALDAFLKDALARIDAK